METYELIYKEEKCKWIQENKEIILEIGEKILNNIKKLDWSKRQKQWKKYFKEFGQEYLQLEAMTFISEKGVKEIADRIQRNRQIWQQLQQWSNVQDEEVDSWVIVDSSKLDHRSLKLVKSLKSEIILE